MNITKKTVTTFEKEERISSYDFWKTLNQIRKDEGASEIQHGDFIKRVEDECDFFNSESFVVKNTRGNRELKAYKLNRDQMLLVGMRESKVIRKQVLVWLKELSAKVETLKDFNAERATASLNYVHQGAMIKHTRDADGKITKFWHYSNEADLLNTIVLGMTAKQYRAFHGFDSTVNLRNTLTTIQLECIAQLEMNNTAFISAGIEREQRKVLLEKILNRDFTQRLINEHMRLEA